MYGRGGLDRFKKAQTVEPFSMTSNSSSKPSTQHVSRPLANPSALHTSSQTSYIQLQNQTSVSQKASGQDVASTAVPASQVTQVGGGQSTWQPPDWAIEPRPGVYYLEVVKDGEVLDRINLEKRRHLFGRQFHTCDFVLDHQSVSRQHAVVVPHRNGSIYVIDLGSAHGTFVANERLTKDSPVELEVGQSLRFAASTRTYILRKNSAALFPPPPQPANINIPPPPDPSDEEAVLAYNTFLNRFGLTRPDSVDSSSSLGGRGEVQSTERAAKRMKRMRVAFKDQLGGELFEVVGISDGADVETEPGPVGVKEGSLVGKYESLVQITVIPKGKDQSSLREVIDSQPGVTEKLKQVLNKVKAPPKSGIYDDLYGETLSEKLGSSWAYSSVGPASIATDNAEAKSPGLNGNVEAISSNDSNDNDDDLFG